MSEARAGAATRSVMAICTLALFTAALSMSLRTGASGAIKAALLDPAAPDRSGEMIGTVMGNSFLGFALSLLIISPFLDWFGARRVILFAAVCFLLGPVLILLAPAMDGFKHIYALLNIGMVVCGLGWGATEASINPVTTALYPDDKTGQLNILHAWWPAGIVVGGLAGLGLTNLLGLDWRALIALIMVPAVIFGLWALRHEFPRTESKVLGVPFGEMIAEPLKRPSFWLFFVIMFLTASTELAPGSWVDVALTHKVGMPGILVLVYVSALMFVMRHFAGALERRFSDVGLLWLCCVPAALGLYLLGSANSPATALAAATLWAFGVCFMWPTMLAAIARRCTRGGPWAIGLIGFAGAMAIYFVLPQIGRIYDQAKLARAGGEAAFTALKPGPELAAILNHASEQSFRTIALLPVLLFFIFGALWLLERRGKRR